MEKKAKVAIAVAAVVVIAFAASVATGTVRISVTPPWEHAEEQGDDKVGQEQAEEQLRPANQKLVESDLEGVGETGATEADVDEMLVTLNGYKRRNLDFGIAGLEVSGGEGGRFKVVDKNSGTAYTLLKGMTTWAFSEGYADTDLEEAEGTDAESIRRALEAEHAGRQDS